MTEKQKKFIDEYLIDLNATQAAIRAGYNKKTAYAIGSENLKKLEIQRSIAEKQEEIKSEAIAERTEILETLTAIMRNQKQEEVVVVEKQADGTSLAVKIKKDVATKDRIKAAELLGKRYSMFTEKLNIESNQSVIIVDDIPSTD